jgi:hypothetical protein
MENKPPKKRIREINFERYLWNKYQPLHDRLMNKIAYLSKVLASFNDIYHVKKEYYKNIKPLMNNEIPPCKEEDNIKEVITFVRNTNDKYNEYEKQMYTEIIKNLKDLIEKMKREKNLYDDYVNSLALYNDEKKKMENLKKIYHQNAQIAEKSTLYLKELVIKKKLNNEPLINKQIDLSENESKNRLTAMSKDCTAYIASLDKVNKSRIELNQKQSILLKTYQSLEKDDKTLYSKIMDIMRAYQKKILDYTGEGYNKTEALQKNIDIDRDMRKLIEELRSRDKPEEEIPYVHYPTEIDFDKCSDTKDYKVFNEMVKTIKKYHNRVFNDYDEKLEEKKNKMRELIYKFFDMNKVTDNEDRKQLLEYIKDEKTHELFLIVLSKLRTNNRFCREKHLIELVSEILLTILNVAQKNNNYISAKNCVILSQTFYYLDESKNKVYIVDKIKKHPWISSMKFWKDFILIMILKEFKKLEDMNPESKLVIAKNINVTDNIKPKIGEILFSQLLPYVGNMNEFGIKKKYIIKIINDINKRFNYINKANFESIINIVCSTSEEMEQVQKEIDEDPELKGSCLNEQLINPKKGDDDDDDE